MLKRFVPFVAVLLLGACTITPPPAATGDVQADLAALGRFTVADLQAAQADAIAHNDVIAAACYPALIQFVSGLPAVGGTVAGAFSAFQQARDLHKGVSAGLPDYLRLGCAALVQDEKQMILKLAAIGAGAAATSGASVMVPFIPIQ